ncbi:Stk1 family PASTA domain-containing Ser/Thr kinase [Microbacterium sp. 2C]|uniref:Stk1 family PASTA domain-containing Ser/Thr kinase n=1 Tax=Microbacterium paulum TaxID=2707006 RepID=UPI0018C2BC60|nr:Stk1 family PASTA domain-containing Ser/Thr kinase [Microbacterium paulum]
MSTSQQTDPLIGRLVDGRYRVRARIARGGMATVYVATDLRLERRVALKVMHSHLSDDTVFQGRFIQEARAAARLADPHVVNVFDQGQDGEMAYLVMEYLPGITLRDLLREQRRLSIPQTITIMDAVLSGLAAAHRAGIVHRDVKPENVLLAEDGRIKIGDFGLARATSANTATGQMLLGTIAYLAPELVTRGTADARSDIYALGIMLYEMLVGEQPYKGEQPMQIAYQHATDSVPRPSAKNPGVPEQLDELVMWATEREPDERPIDARAMLDRLREIEKDLGVFPHVVRTPAPGLVAVDEGVDSGEVTKIMPGTFTAPTVTDAVDNATLLRRRSRRNTGKGWWLVVLVLLLAGLAGGTGWWFGSGPGSLVAVPDVTGSSLDEATTALAAQSLVAVPGEDYSRDVAAGLAIRTEPGTGERVEKDSQVTVVISLGPASHDIGALSGMSLDEATRTLEQLYITSSGDPSQVFTDTPAGSVVAASITPPRGGDAVDCTKGCAAFEGSTVSFEVSAGAIPDVSGRSVGDATSALAAVKLSVTTDEEYNDDVAEGKVIRVTESESPVRPGDTVTLVVSKGPEPIAIPSDVVGSTIRDAVDTLEALGFKVNAGIEDGDLPLGFKYWDVYKVRATNPKAGTSAPKGSTITLTPGL